jgi:2-methylisocitrate lyase-like PEP mutase family enzyme
MDCIDSAQVLMDEAIIQLKLTADAGADVCFIGGVKTRNYRNQLSRLALKPAVVAAPLETQIINIIIQLQFV